MDEEPVGVVAGTKVSDLTRVLNDCESVLHAMALPQRDPEMVSVNLDEDWEEFWFDREDNTRSEGEVPTEVLAAAAEEGWAVTRIVSGWVGGEARWVPSIELYPIEAIAAGEASADERLRDDR